MPYIKGKILDYGAGKGIVSRKLPNVTNYDPYFYPDKPKGKFDTVLLIYVLNVLTKNERLSVLRDALKYVKHDGYLIIAVRPACVIRSSAKAGKWKRFEDGYITSRNTFQTWFGDFEIALAVRKCDTSFSHVDKIQNTYMFRKVGK